MLEKPATILKAARTAGIPIPTLCNNDILEPYGGCRLCLVEVERVPRLQTACTQFVTDGMVIWTETERVIEARKAILEFLLINHPLDCPYCDKAGECDLQDLVVKYGLAAARFAEGKRKRPELFDDPLIVRNMERCILCSQCVRMCEDVQGAYAISIINRGSRSFVEPFSGGRYNCEYCGNCLTVCPVGAITPRLPRHGFRPWLIEKEVETVCLYCGVGCSLVLQMRGNSVVRSIPRIGLGVNRGILCSKGRFGYDCIHSSKRLDTPLIRRNGTLQRATWAEALTYVAQRLKEIKEEHGGDAIAGIASGRCTNEDVYVFQKFFRGAIGTNNIDSSASLAYGPAQRFFERLFGQGITANYLDGISNSDGILVIGGDPAAVNPVLGLQIRSAHKRGAPVVVVGYAQGLRGFTAHRLLPRAMMETLLLAGLVSALREKKPLPKERPIFEKLLQDLQPAPLKDVSDRSGIAMEELTTTVNTLSAMSNPSVIIGRDIVQTTRGHENLLLIASLVYLLNGKIYLLSELPNEQGVLDMGCEPDMLPSGRPLAFESFRRWCEDVLKVNIPLSPGLRYVEIIESAYAGRIRALYTLGENVALSLPDTAYVKEALKKIGFLVVQDFALTETAEIAHVVLPAPSWSEKEGSYTNLERRVQFMSKAVEGRALEEWRTVAEISKILGIEMGYVNPADIGAEIARVSLLYGGITYEEMKSGRCMWPYKGEPLRHSVHIGGITWPDIDALMAGTGSMKVYAYRERCLFHSENLSRYSSALTTISPEPSVGMSKNLAEQLALGAGDRVEVSTERGSMTLPVRLAPDLPENIVLIPDFENRGVLDILSWKVNPAIKVPTMDGIEVTLKKEGMSTT